MDTHKQTPISLACPSLSSAVDARIDGVLCSLVMVVVVVVVAVVIVVVVVPGSLTALASIPSAPLALPDKCKLGNTSSRQATR